MFRQINDQNKEEHLGCRLVLLLVSVGAHVEPGSHQAALAGLTLTSSLSLLPKQPELLVSDTLPRAECLILDIKKYQRQALRPQLPALTSVSGLARSSLHWPSQTQTLVLSPRFVYLVMQGS